MPLDAATRDGEAKLLAILLAGVEVEASQAQPANGQVLHDMADFKDPQRATRQLGTVVHRRVDVLVLQGALAGHTEA